MKKYVSILSIFLCVLLLSSCQNKRESSESDPKVSSLANSGSSSVSLNSSDSSHSDTSHIVEEVIMDDASMDFTQALGFKVSQWVGVEPTETKVIDNQIAEVMCDLDMSNVFYLRIAKQGVKNLTPTLDGVFETIQVIQVNGISVEISYAVEGPMQATWEKDGFIFCYYHKKGELTLAEEVFPERLSYYVNDVLLVSQ